VSAVPAVRATCETGQTGTYHYTLFKHSYDSKAQDITPTMPDGGTLAGKPITAGRLQSIAQQWADQYQAEDQWHRCPISRLPDALLSLSDEYCRDVAAYYDRAPAWTGDASLMHGYDRLKEENLRLYHRIRAEGIVIEPWLGGDQPYQNSAQLRADVRRTGRLRVFLTAHGHGPRSGTRRHPLRELSGVRAGSVEFRHNDLFRAVHDIFGHVMLEAGFGVKGEFLAAFCQLQMYPREVHSVVFTEQVGQICWFFRGPHLMRPDGSLPRSGQPGYVPPHSRPYPEQKVFAFPTRFLDAFISAFQLTRSSDD